jgi:hypothetical protein
VFKNIIDKIYLEHMEKTITLDVKKYLSSKYAFLKTELVSGNIRGGSGLQNSAQFERSNIKVSHDEISCFLFRSIMETMINTMINTDITESDICVISKRPWKIENILKHNTKSYPEFVSDKICSNGNHNAILNIGTIPIALIGNKCMYEQFYTHNPTHTEGYCVGYNMEDGLATLFLSQPTVSIRDGIDDQRQIMDLSVEYNLVLNPNIRVYKIDTINKKTMC